MIITVALSERAVVFREGRPWRFLRPGRHRLWAANSTEVVRYNVEDVQRSTRDLAAIVPAEEGQEVHVPEGTITLVWRDELPAALLVRGRYVVWKASKEITTQSVGVNGVRFELPHGFPLPENIGRRLVVHPFEKALLLVDGVVQEVLSEGAYTFYLLDRHVETVLVDQREQETTLTGQEVLTADKATLRANLVVRYRVVDPVAWFLGAKDVAATLYTEAQLVYRRHVAGSTLDQLLEARSTLGLAMRDEVAGPARAWGVEVLAFDLKDVILPGDMKTMFTRVLEAEKQALAQGILRREEAASTRSLANAARLYENNPTMLRLKELEQQKEIAAKVGHLTVITGR